MTLTSRLISALILIAATICAQRANSAESLQQRIKQLRALSDDRRTVETKKLALEIRALPNHNDALRLALALSSLATEGDCGRDTLHEVEETVAEEIKGAGHASDSAYDELARVVHYEGLDITLDDPGFEKALVRLDSADQVRQKADFTLHDLAGKSWRLKELEGKVVLVNFWATWCPPCRKEMPDLDRLYKRYAAKGLVILAISDEEDAKVRPFITAQKYTYPILLDPGSAVNKRLLVQGIPKSLVYDRTGKLVAQSTDMRTMTQFLDMLKRAGLEE
jgi:thiol-disulfide isomerase/thioredoxin